jgi:hypothetical protein
MRAIVWVGAGCIALILVVGGWNVLATSVLHGDVTPRTLFVSVERASNGGDPTFPARHRVCHRMPEPGAWRCEVDDPGGSGGFSNYRVKVTGSCWDATGGGSQNLPRRASGCVHLQED